MSGYVHEVYQPLAGNASTSELHAMQQDAAEAASFPAQDPPRLKQPQPKPSGSAQRPLEQPDQNRRHALPSRLSSMSNVANQRAAALSLPLDCNPAVLLKPSQNMARALRRNIQRRTNHPRTDTVTASRLNDPERCTIRRRMPMTRVAPVTHGRSPKATFREFYPQLFCNQ